MTKARMETRIDEMSRQIAELIAAVNLLQRRLTDMEERFDTRDDDDDDDEQTIREMEDSGE